MSEEQHTGGVQLDRNDYFAKLDGELVYKASKSHEKELQNGIIQLVIFYAGQ